MRRLLWIVSLAFIVRWAAIEAASHLARARARR
jgi:hypothetical protein